MSITVPPGQIIVNEKWQGSELATLLQKQIQVIFLDTEMIDFHPCSDSAAIYITEAALISGTEYRKNIVKLRKVSYPKKLVIFEKTSVTESYFQSTQNFTTLELGLQSLPVSSQAECANLLIFLVKHSSSEHTNPFRTEKRMPPIQTCILNCLVEVPCLSQTKAELLLQTFPSLKAISGATTEELAGVIGQKSAIAVYKFFHEKA